MAWLIPGLPLLLAGRFAGIPMIVISVPLAVALIVMTLRELPSAWPHGIRDAWDHEPRRVPRPGSGGRSARAGTGRARARRGPPAGGCAVVGSGRDAHGGGRVRCVAVRRELPADHRAPRPGDLPAVRLLDRWARLDPHPGIAAGLRRRPSGPHVQQPRLLPGRFVGGAAVHGGTADAAGHRRVGGRRRSVPPRWPPSSERSRSCPSPGWPGGWSARAGLRRRRWSWRVCLPEQYTSRATFSETLAQLMLYGGLCMLADSFVLTGGRHVAIYPGPSSWRDGPAPNVTLAFFGGLSIGLTLLVRIDGLSDLLPALPFLGVLLVRKRPQGVPFGIGLFIGAAYGFADGYLLSRPYLDSIGPSLRPLAMIALGVVAVTVVGMGLVSLPRTRSWLRALVRLAPGSVAPGGRRGADGARAHRVRRPPRTSRRSAARPTPRPSATSRNCRSSRTCPSTRPAPTPRTACTG